MNARLPINGVLGDRSTRGVLLAASRDPDAKMTFLLTAPTTRHTTAGLVCKIPTTETARCAVRREAQALVDLRRMSLGHLAPTIPRYVSSGPTVGGDPDRALRHEPSAEMLISTQLPGRPMSHGYHQWRHTSRRRAVVTDFDLALGWLESLWTETGTARAPLTWAGEVADELSRRWDGNDLLEAAVDRLRTAHAAMASQLCPRVTVHGDFWFGNVLLDNGAVSGVVDWEASEAGSWPLRDVARFVLSYSLYLDRHTRVGRPVPGHPGLRREGNGAALAYGLLGQGWYPSLVRERLARGLRQLGLPTHLWYDVALTGIGEIAANANEDEFGRDHLRLLVTLPHRPSRPRGRAR
jgi:hypothetical protein